MSKENTTVEEGKKKPLPIKEACLVVAGIIIGIIISYGLFTSAIKDAANEAKIEVTTSNVETTEKVEDTTAEKKEDETSTKEDETSSEVESTKEEETTEKAETESAE